MKFIIKAVSAFYFSTQYFHWVEREDFHRYSGNLLSARKSKVKDENALWIKQTRIFLMMCCHILLHKNNTIKIGPKIGGQRFLSSDHINCSI